MRNMQSLSVLLADETAITQLPPSMVNLKKLKILSLNGCKTSSSGSISSLIWSWISQGEVPKESNQLTVSLSGLRSLTHLSLRDCNLSDDSIPAGFGSLQSLKVLDLGENNFHHLPASISRLSKLAHMSVEHCVKLESLPDLPSSLTTLNANNCLSLERLSLSTRDNTEMVGLMNCSKLVEIFGLDKWRAGGSIRLDGCKNLSTGFKEFLMKDWERGRFVIPGDDIPEWFEHRSFGPSISFQLPPCNGCKLELITLGIVYTPNAGPYRDIECPAFTLTDKANKLNLTEYLAEVFPHTPLPPEDHTFMFHFAPSDIMGDSGHRYTRVQLDLDCDNRWTIKGIRVHLQIDLCQRCQLSSMGNTVIRNSGLLTSQEVIPCDNPDPSASYTEQIRANTKRGGTEEVVPGSCDCPVKVSDSPEHKRMRYELPCETDSVGQNLLVYSRYI